MKRLFNSARFWVFVLAVVWSLFSVLPGAESWAHEGPGHSADGTISVAEQYARSSGSKAKSGAVFLVLQNSGPADDRLISVTTPVAARAELHTHFEDSNGVMMMRPIEDGIVVPSGQQHMLERGGDHIMLMGLIAPLVQGDLLTFILTFEKAGEVTVIVPVDLER